MKRIQAGCAAVASVVLMIPSAGAEISAEAARASVAPFYKALNAEFARESPELIKQRPPRTGSHAAATMFATRARK